MSNLGDRFTDVDLGNKRLPACYGYITWKLLTLEEAMKDLHGLLPEINRFVKLAKRHCTHPDQHSLSKDEAATIYLYTMEMSDDICVYRILNHTLRVEDRSKVRPWFGYLKLLDSATSKLPKFKGIVWRGVNKDVTASFKRGQKITWWSVTSCSTSVDVISAFLDKTPQSTLFNIECANGKLIAAYTCYPQEDEVILMPGATFEVVGNPLHHHGGLHIIHLKEITEDDEDEDDVEKQGATGTASASASISVAQKFSTMNIDSYSPTHSAVSTAAVPKSSTASSKPSPPPPPPKLPAAPKPIKEEFAKPGTYKELYCKGRHCAECGKCRDWYYTGNNSSWQWIRNVNNWKAEDWARYNNDRVWERFKKRDGAKCYGDFVVGCLCQDNVQNS